MASPFSHSIAGAGSFTALLTADEDDFVSDDFEFTVDQKPFLLSPLPETLESIIPPSVLSGQHFADQIFSFPPPETIDPPFLADQYRSIYISPRNRAFEQIPVCSPQIPSLRSPEEFPPMKLPRVEPPPSLESILSGFSLSGFVEALVSLASPDVDDGAAPVRTPKAAKGKKRIVKDYAKDRRKKISEKVRKLGSILPAVPGAPKPDLASILEHAHSYIMFLQAQVKALESMPTQSSAYGAATAFLSSDVAGLLGSLTRQQLLQAFVNSPAAQALLTSENCCVVSAEQVVELKKLLCESLSAAMF